MPNDEVVFLNPRTCGIYKNGGIRYKTDPATGERTSEVDNEMIEAVNSYLRSQRSEGESHVPIEPIFESKVLVPTYYDERYSQGINEFLSTLDLEAISIGELLDQRIIKIRGGHGSPANDQRRGSIPYIKVSDIRGLRINVNPTNLVSEVVAKRFWGGEDSQLRAWDLITPNRASSNIGEFAILLPREEKIVITKEVFVIRILNNSLWSPFYLLWALSLRVVREQWRRIALMQTNREDCGERYKEIILPMPKNKRWAESVSKPFREYFTLLAEAKGRFIAQIAEDPFNYVANVYSSTYAMSEIDEEENNSME